MRIAPGTRAMLDRGWLIERRYPSAGQMAIGKPPDGAIHQGTVGAADGRGAGLGAKAEVEAGRVTGLGAEAEAGRGEGGEVSEFL